MNDVTSDYLGPALSVTGLEYITTRAQELLSGVEFEAFAFCGISGALVAPVLALAMNKKLVLVRRQIEIDTSHTTLVVEGNLLVKNYVIVDDMIDTGKTVEYIQSHMEWTCAVCKGILLYSSISNRRKYKGIPVWSISPMESDW